MKARLRIIVAVSVLLSAGAPALAQETPAPPTNEVIGPPQLKDFSLNGTVTRPAPAPQEQAQPQREPQQQQTRPTPAQRNQPADTTARETAPSRDVSPPQSEPVQSSPAGSSDLPPPPPPVEDSVAAPDAVAPVPGSSTSPSATGLPGLTWILAALAAAGAAAWLLLRRRPRESFAGAGEVETFEPAPAPTPEPAPPPAIAKPEPAPTGIVSARLRPWLEIEFRPVRGVIDNEKATVGFELSVYNSGSVPARDVHITAALISGGAMQEQQIRLFFDSPQATDNAIPVIPPLQRVALEAGVALPRDQIRPLEIEGRQLFVPMVAFNAVYRWSGGTGQTSASYLVGKETSGEKLAPFRLDQGSRIFRSLAAREHELRVRN